MTHTPTGLSAERERTKDLESSVQAQAACIDELRRRVEAGAHSQPAESPPDEQGQAVGRAEFDALAARVADLERRLS